MTLSINFKKKTRKGSLGNDFLFGCCFRDEPGMFLLAAFNSVPSGLRFLLSFELLTQFELLVNECSNNGPVANGEFAPSL